MGETAILTLQEYNNMTTASLVDLLAQETEKFTRLMAHKEFTTEYNDVKNTIRIIQGVIESRNESTQTHPNSIV